MAEIVIRLLKEDDIQQVNDLYERAYKINRSTEKFKWEFQQGPAGPAIYIVAVDPETNKVIGTQCAIPLYVTNSSGANVLTAKSEDTLVDPDYRGRSVFEKMYALLFDECRKAGVVAIWGFTYAVKPFRKLGFDIPFACDFGLMVFNTTRAFKYFNNLKEKRSFVEKIKIAGLVTLARLKPVLQSKPSAAPGYTITNNMQTSLEELPPAQSDVFFLKLDAKFLEWRLRTNPYPNSHLYYTLVNDSGVQAGSIICSHTPEVSYIMHMAFARNLSEETRVYFLCSAIRDLSGKTAVVRFWGFTHNAAGRQEIELLKKCGFVFTNQGISFVWRKLDDAGTLNVSNFALSRMASQGT